MTVAMIFLCLTAGGVLCCALFEKQLEETLAVGPLAIVFVLYWGGLLGALKESVYLVLAICALCYALALCTAWQRRRLRPLLKNIFTPGFWVWLLLFALVWYTNRGKLIHYYDEFTHWGDVVKVMCEIDDFSTHPASRSLFASYPPGMALLQYFVQKANGLLLNGREIDEPLVYMTYQWAMLSLFTPFLKGLHYRKPWRIAFAAGAVYIVPVMIYTSSAYALVYIDAYLATLSGFVCAFAFLKENPDGVDTAMVCLALFMLVLTKDVGLLFALGGAAVFSLGLWLERRAEGVPQAGLKRGQRVFKGALAVGFVIAAKASWAAHIAARGARLAQSGLSRPMGPAQWLAMLRGSPEQLWRKEVLNNYIQRFFDPIFRFWATDGYLSYAALIIVVGTGLYLLARRTQRQEKMPKARLTALCMVCAIMTAAHIIGLCGMYLFKFSMSEAKSLASWTRYIELIAATLFTVTALLALHCRLSGNFRGGVSGYCGCGVPSGNALSLSNGLFKRRGCEAGGGIAGRICSACAERKRKNTKR